MCDQVCDSKLCGSNLAGKFGILCMDQPTMNLGCELDVSKSDLE